MKMEDLKNNILRKTSIPKKDELLNELKNMQALITGRYDIFFANIFIKESVELLINSIFLIENGYFDCAFYSLRQANENINSMLYIASEEYSLIKWQNKDRFRINSKIEKELKTHYENYKEINNKLSFFFDELDTLIQSTNKIVHKQGFDTFYVYRQQNLDEIQFTNEIAFFDKLLRYSICNLYILLIVVDPFVIALNDENINKKINYDIVTTPINLNFISENLSIDLLSLVRETNFYNEVIKYFENNEEMNSYVYDVIHHQFFDVENLDKINSQKYLLNKYEQIALLILNTGIKISEIHIDGLSVFPYWTSIKSNYNRSEFIFNEFDKFSNNKENFNNSYHNVYVSYLFLNNTHIFIQHNHILSEQEKKTLSSLSKNSRA